MLKGYYLIDTNGNTIRRLVIMSIKAGRKHILNQFADHPEADHMLHVRKDKTEHTYTANDIYSI
jgi:hypothetical protein